MDEENSMRYILNDRYAFEIKQQKLEMEDIFWHNVDPKTAQIMFKNSKLMPPPQKMQSEKQKLCKKAVSEHKQKLKLIFRRLTIENTLMLRAYETNPFMMANACFLHVDEYNKFISQIEPNIEMEFKKIANQALIHMKQADYQRMDDVLDKLHVWVKKIQEKVKEQYSTRIGQYRLSRQQQQNQKIYDKYLKDCETSDRQHEFSSNSMSFSMKHLQQEIAKIYQDSDGDSRKQNRRKNSYKSYISQRD